MKIVVIVRTKNEGLNMGRFCTNYRDCADLILVADGGSEDHTVDIAKCFANVKVRDFTERIEFEVNGMSVKSFYERIPRVLKVKSYSGIDDSTVKKIKKEDVKMTLDILSKQRKIFKYQGCYAPQKTALKTISEI